MKEYINPIRPIISDENFTLDEKMEVIESTLEKIVIAYMQDRKTKIFKYINSIEEKEFTRADARIIVDNYLRQTTTLIKLNK